MAAEESIVGDLPLKRPREEGEEQNGALPESNANMDMDNSNKEPQSVSSVIPGWFSEISPMWPGTIFVFLIVYVYVFRLVSWFFVVCYMNSYRFVDKAWVFV